jgi:hypothetical protein
MLAKPKQGSASPSRMVGRLGLSLTAAGLIGLAACAAGPQPNAGESSQSDSGSGNGGGSSASSGAAGGGSGSGAGSGSRSDSVSSSGGSAQDANPAGANDAGGMTAEGCPQNDTCSCVETGAAFCSSGTGALCTKSGDCALAGSICVLMGAEGGFCAKPCNRAGGCTGDGGATCPSGFQCSTLAGTSSKACMTSGAYAPPTCTGPGGCSSLPGATCVAAAGGLGMFCILTCN